MLAKAPSNTCKTVWIAAIKFIFVVEIKSNPETLLDRKMMSSGSG